MAKNRNINVVIKGDYDNSDVQRAIKELQKLQGVSSQTQKATSGMSGAFKALAIAGAAVGIGLLTRGIGDMISAAEESAKVQATTAQIIKSTGGAAKVSAEQVSELSRRLSEQMGIDDELIQSSSNLLLTFKNVKNEGEGLNAMFDRATIAAQDLAASGFGDASSAAKMLGKALNDPISGMTALSKAGVTFSEGQKDQIKALMASNNMLGAQKLIMAEVESQVGGVATATATATGKLSVMMGNMQEDIGGALLPFVAALAEGLGPALKELTPALTSVAGSIGTVLVGAINLLLPAIVGVVTVIANMTAALLNNRVVVVLATSVLAAWTLGLIAGRVAAIGASISNLGFAATFPILTAVTGFATTAMVGFRLAVAAALGPIGLLIIAVTAAIVLLPKLFDGATKVNSAYATMKNAAGDAAIAVGQAGAVASNVASVLGVHKKATEASTRSTEELARSTAYAEDLYSQYRVTAELAADRTEEIAKQAEAAAAALDKSASSALNAAEAYALFSMTGYSPDPTRDSRNAQARATALLNANIEAINGAREAGKKTGGAAASAAIDAIKSKADKFKEAGQFVTDTLAGGFAAGETAVLGAVGTLMNKAVSKASKYDSAFADVMANVTDAISQKLVEALTVAKDGLKAAQDEAASWASSMASTLAGAFDISSVFKDSLDEDGQVVVSKWKDGVNKAFAQFEWYTNVLTAIKANKGGDALMQYLISQGVEQGGAQGQAMLDQGLIPYFNEKLNAVVELSKTTANAMIPAYLQAGIESAQQTYDGLKLAIGKDGPVYNAIQKLMDNLAKSMSRNATITVTTINRVVTELSTVTASSGGTTSGPITIPQGASGGIVNVPTVALIGEAGPEAVIPLDRSPGNGPVGSLGGGPTYNITVQAGVGDPRAIGQSVIEVIRKYENANGRVFAAA